LSEHKSGESQKENKPKDRSTSSNSKGIPILKAVDEGINSDVTRIYLRYVERTKALIIHKAITAVAAAANHAVTSGIKSALISATN
jgi:hypothetical protein